MTSISPLFTLFFFNDTSTTEIYTLSLHDALPICCIRNAARSSCIRLEPSLEAEPSTPIPDRKSTRLNSSHTVISYAVFCLKKKKHGPLLLRAEADKSEQRTYLDHGVHYVNVVPFH